MCEVTLMESDLEKIDAIRARFKVGYAEAAQSLSSAEGDVVNALVSLEKKGGVQANLVAIGMEMVDEAQRIISGAPVKRLRIRYGDRTVTDTPIALTAAATLAIGVMAVLISKLVIQLERGEEGAVR